MNKKRDGPVQQSIRNVCFWQKEQTQNKPNRHDECPRQVGIIQVDIQRVPRPQRTDNPTQTHEGVVHTHRHTLTRACLFRNQRRRAWADHGIG